MASIGNLRFQRHGRLHFICPLCQHNQSTNTIKRVGWRSHVQLSVLTVASLFLLWPIFGLKGLGLYFPYWAAFEFAYRLRKRQALICQSCGFDPFLYKQDVKKAREALRRHWEAKIEKENLFAGLKLKNYRTASVKQDAAEPSPVHPPSPTSDGRLSTPAP